MDLKNDLVSKPSKFTTKIWLKKALLLVLDLKSKNEIPTINTKILLTIYIFENNKLYLY